MMTEVQGDIETDVKNLLRNGGVTNEKAFNELVHHYGEENVRNTMRAQWQASVRRDRIMELIWLAGQEVTVEGFEEGFKALHAEAFADRLYAQELDPKNVYELAETLIAFAKRMEVLNLDRSEYLWLEDNIKRWAEHDEAAEKHEEYWLERGGDIPPFSRQV